MDFVEQVLEIIEEASQRCAQERFLENEQKGAEAGKNALQQTEQLQLEATKNKQNL